MTGIYEQCPRCDGTQKYEADQRIRNGCASWWHQYLWLPDIWLEREMRVLP